MQYSRQVRNNEIGQAKLGLFTRQSKIMLDKATI